MTARTDQRSLYERVFLYLSRRPGQRFAAYQLARALNVRIIMILDAMDILSEQGRVVAEPLSPQHLGYFAVPVQGSQGPALEYKGLSEGQPARLEK
ncbi:MULTISPECIES: hypothetical protein [Cupriavidus]|jgi:hypothetical protein|uniref:hypothetical protein n=1 Tax=Cupriavidus TaxID=106589 RepID=UPI0004677461|nr:MULTISPECIES: hypothetical protein [Cupriavidus]KWR71427.1 hypothetical protein RN01_31620 [Cupriavidus sp. SHE]QWC91613.1 hypothetical protein KB891_17755 [Cupriavidus metallidurans]